MQNFTNEFRRNYERDTAIAIRNWDRYTRCGVVVVLKKLNQFTVSKESFHYASDFDGLTSDPYQSRRIVSGGIKEHGRTTVSAE